ncbi:MAG: hypothetical protein IPM16_05320 [Chloroflexi bacterium]|nr:hypothetical protein [Chloroflexota bacterium]
MAQQIEYRGWPGCVHLGNGSADVVVSASFGPRILHYGPSLDVNLFGEQYDAARALPANAWKLVGGHRFWIAPEDTDITYIPDNDPIEVESARPGTLQVRSVDAKTQIEKQLDLSLAPQGTEVVVSHTLINRGVWPVRVAPWALSVMPLGGRAVMPLPERRPHSETLLPAGSLVCWAYTDLGDPRWSYAPTGIMLDGVPGQPPQKMGTLVEAGWLAYWQPAATFIKRFDVVLGADYPDFGCSAELFTNEYFLEVETLGPLVWLEPGASVDHVETWQFRTDLPRPDRASMETWQAAIEGA